MVHVLSRWVCLAHGGLRTKNLSQILLLSMQNAYHFLVAVVTTDNGHAVSTEERPARARGVLDLVHQDTGQAHEGRFGRHVADRGQDGPDRGAVGKVVADSLLCLGAQAVV